MAKILLVEDDSALASGIQYALEREGWAVDVKGGQAEALASLRSKSYDLLILDIMLADGDGFDICRYVRKTSDVPIMFLTARDEEVSVVMGLDMGADDYITKPFRLRELISRVRALLRRTGPKGQRSDTVLTAGGFTLDLVEHTLRSNQGEIPLTATEFRLLETLMRNSGQTVSRDRLLESLWDANGQFVDPNTLSVYIKRLRSKIEPDPTNPKHIVTCRGLGYRWAVEE